MRLSERQLTYRLKLWGYLKKDVVTSTNLDTPSYAEQFDGTEVSLVTSDVVMRDVFPVESRETTDKLEKDSPMSSNQQYLPKTAALHACSILSIAGSEYGLCEIGKTTCGIPISRHRSQWLNIQMTIDARPPIKVPERVLEAESPANRMSLDSPDNEAHAESAATESSDVVLPELRQLLDKVHLGRKTSKAWSINRLLSIMTRNAERHLDSDDLIQIDILADVLSAASIYRGAFLLSHLVAIHTIRSSPRTDIDLLKANLTRLVRNAANSTDLREVKSVLELATRKFGSVDSVDIPGKLLASHLGYSCYTDGEPEVARTMCEKAFSGALNRWGSWAAVAELHANWWNSLTSSDRHCEAMFLESWEEALTGSMKAVELGQTNDSLGTVFQWIHNVLATTEIPDTYVNQADVLWDSAPDDYAQADIESTSLFSFLWNKWQERKDMAESTSVTCENAFQLLQTACGLTFVELISALARLVTKWADRGVKADLFRRASDQVLRMVNEPRLRNIAHLLNSHVEPLYMKAHRLSNPGYDALRQKAVCTLIETNTSIPETLLYDSRLRKTTRNSGSLPGSPFLTSSLRSSCDTDLRSFKGVMLRQLAKRFSKASSHRWSQISEMSIATFSSSERWLKANTAESQGMPLLEPSANSKVLSTSTPNRASYMTMISVDRDLISSYWHDRLHAGESADRMQVDTEMSG
jgi:hypothetical protein